MKSKKTFKILIWISYLLVFVMLTYISLNPKFKINFDTYEDFKEYDIVKIDKDITLNCSDGTSKIVNLPYTAPFSSKTYSYEFIPIKTFNDDDLMFLEIHSEYCSYKIKYKEELIYSLNNKNSSFPKSGTYSLKYIKIDNKYLGKNLKIEFKQNIASRFGIIIPKIRTGTKSSLIRFHHRIDFFSVIYSTIFFITFINLMIFAIFFWRYKIKNHNITTTAMICLLLCNFVVVKRTSIYLLFQKNVYLYSAVYMSLMILPICLLYMLKHEFTRNGTQGVRTKIINVVIFIAIGNTVFQLVSFLLEYKEFLELYRFSEYILIVSVLCMIILPLTIKSKNSKYKFTYKLMSIILSVTFSFIVILHFLNIQTGNLIYITFFTFLFLIIQSVISIKTGLDQYKDYYVNKLYKEMAFMDNLTKLANRNAYETDIKNLDKNTDKTKNILVMVFDINNLKKINDSMGHHKGDRLIRGVANILKVVENMNKQTKAYRTGGDEFILISKNIEKDSPEIILNIIEQEKNRFIEKNSDLPFSFALAYEIAKLDKNLNFDELISIIDKKMYKNKSNYKKTYK